VNKEMTAVVYAAVRCCWSSPWRLRQNLQDTVMWISDLPKWLFCL